MLQGCDNQAAVVAWPPRETPAQIPQGARWLREPATEPLACVAACTARGGGKSGASLAGEGALRGPAWPAGTFLGSLGRGQNAGSVLGCTWGRQVMPQLLKMQTALVAAA